MLVAAVIDLGMMLLSAILSAGIHSALVMLAITGGMPMLAIATVAVIEGGVKLRSGGPGVAHGGEFANLAKRLRSDRRWR